MPLLPGRLAPTRWPALPVLLGVLRAGLGLTMLARPMLVPRPLGVDRITAGRISWLVRMLGARDLALGAGTLAAGTDGERSRWLLLGGGSDVVDALAIGRAVRRREVAPVAGALAALAGAAGAALSAAAAAQAPRR